jgi:putative peptidoglycan lipid II flippase
LLTLAAVVGKPITFGRDIAVAHSFGASRLVDFVILAQIVPMLFVGFVSDGAVLSLPAIFRRASGRPENVAMPTTKAYVARMLGYEALALAVGVGIATPLLTSEAPRGAPIPLVILALLSLQALCESASAMYSQLLQIDGRFGRSALQSCLNGALSIILILGLAPLIGIWAWPVGMFVDSLWQAIFLHVSLRSSGPRVTAPRVTVRDLVVAVGPPLALSALTVLYSFTDRIGALAAGVGTLALWTWALRLGNTATGLISQPVATVVFSRGHSRGSREPTLYGAALLVSVALAVLAVVVYEIVGPQIVRLVFGGTRVSPRDLNHLVSLGRFAILAGIPVAMFTVTSRACAARGRFRPVIAAFALGAVLYPVVLALLFNDVGYRSLGIAYLLASAVAAMVNLTTVTRQNWLRFPTITRLRQGV